LIGTGNLIADEARRIREHVQASLQAARGLRFSRNVSEFTSVP
jgi:hypothetical protein